MTDSGLKGKGAGDAKARPAPPECRARQGRSTPDADPSEGLKKSGGNRENRSHAARNNPANSNRHIPGSNDSTRRRFPPTCYPRASIPLQRGRVPFAVQAWLPPGKNADVQLCLDSGSEFLVRLCKDSKLLARIVGPIPRRMHGTDPISISRQAAEEPFAPHCRVW